jgi:hypothetical protein
MAELQPTKEWQYRDVRRGTPAQGPFFLYELVERIQCGMLRPEDLVCRGGGAWTHADRMQELAKAFRSQRAKDELPMQMSEDAARIVGGDASFQQTLDYNRDPRKLPWLGLFVGGLSLSLLATMLVTFGQGERMIAGLVLATLSTLSFALILTAVIRFAVQPLHAQQVDTNLHLKRIAAQLQDASAAMEQRAQQASEEPVA